MTIERTMRIYVVSAFAVLLAAGGCLRRKETITVLPNGSATVNLQYEGEKEEFDTTDALPSERSGWNVSRSTETEKDGKEVVTLSAERRFSAGEDLPASFAAKDDPDAGLYLAFPTAIRKEKRADGVYLHFRRVYSPRPWAYVQYWQDAVMDDSTKKLSEKPIEQLSHDERVQLVKAFAGVEMLKQIEFARQALHECDPELKQDVWLRARESMMKVFEDRDWSEFVDHVADLSEEDRGKLFDKESQQIVAESLDQFRRTLRQGPDHADSQMARFDAAYARAKKANAVTTETGGHAFEIRVHMPGEVIASNADKIDDDGAAVWEFDGTAFRDRPYELMITSRLPVNGDEK